MAGLIPFVGLSGVLAIAPALAPANALTLLAVYAAVILSFMGGVHWGLALKNAAGTSYFASVLPALWAWAAVAFLEPKWSLAAIAAGFAALLLYDVAVVNAGGAPAWYKRLRIGLTAVVVAASCVAAFSTR
jgi:Protein of unknown function (DUF3429)